MAASFRGSTNNRKAIKPGLTLKLGSKDHSLDDYFDFKELTLVHIKDNEVSDAAVCVIFCKYPKSKFIYGSIYGPFMHHSWMPFMGHSCHINVDVYVHLCCINVPIYIHLCCINVAIYVLYM